MILRKYKISENLTLTLSQKALEHVLYGDLTDKPFHTADGRISKKVISGGLHTYSGWLSYLRQNPKLKKVSYFYTDRDDEWFYERELQNGTILLKLPESALTSHAAKMTMHPENNYRSGYLWKTLFPKKMEQPDILKLLDDALLNISTPESREGEIICYYNLEIPLKCIRISILYRNGVINSFYPTWSQPNTGNNGKPFSFFDNIGHVISGSTQIIDDEQHNLADIGLLSELTELIELPDITPSLFLERKTNFSSENLSDWEKLRAKTLRGFVQTCSIGQITEIYNYINDEAISKYHDRITQFAYEDYFPHIQLSEIFYNSTCINQNIVEGLIILFLFDKKYKTNLYSNSALKLISNMFTAPLIDMWAKKRIHRILSSLTLHYHDKSFPAKYLDCIATSPSRRELYSEYFYENHDKKFEFNKAKNLKDIGYLFGVISYPPQDKAVTYSNFLHYFSENLGESYSMHFNEEKRIDFLLKSYPGKYYYHYINGVLRFFSQHVFSRYSYDISCYLEHFSEENTARPDNLYRIIQEYFKLQVAQRQRINLNYAKYHGGAITVNFPPKKEDVYSVILKHERWANRQLTDNVIESVKEYLSKVEDIKLTKILKFIEERDRKEAPRPPIPYGLIQKMVKHPELLNIIELKKVGFI
ncbi:hypothetical protein AB4I13_11075 [Serratia marcescens]|uniref:hypothetical protein n=1 Tax=Serratia marcescens TaxID=615 RepID=UPI001037094C|nr:hypothetical protein [Serratia marcescens]TBU69807.1 hypothetical protein EG355_03680 [Serratia marcescens]